MGVTPGEQRRAGRRAHRLGVELLQSVRNSDRFGRDRPRGVRLGAAGGGQRETGWTVEPQTEEFRTLAVNRPYLERIASQTDGEVLSLDGLESFVASLPNRKIPMTESWTYPLWHQWHIFVLAMACLVGEWGLRRWKGLA